MPQIVVAPDLLAPFGEMWRDNGGRLSRTPPFSSSQLGLVFDNAVGQAMAVMLGGVPVVTPNANSLTPAQANCVEVGPVRVIGGIRPQNFDVGYRPDGIRFVFDSKTLNDASSLRKNWQNMINDLATEATTVHSRFPHAVAAFMVIIPRLCIVEPQLSAIIETLERLARRFSVQNPDYLAEAIALVLWNVEDGTIDNTFPAPSSPLRLENFSAAVENAYLSRYKGLPPHTMAD